MVTKTLITTQTCTTLCSAEQIEICGVDIFTLAFQQDCSAEKKDDRRVKTNWCAPNLHIDWELHQASLMSSQKKTLKMRLVIMMKLPFRIIRGSPNQEPHTFKHNQLQCFSSSSTRGTALCRCLQGGCFEADLNDNNLMSCLKCSN